MYNAIQPAENKTKVRMHSHTFITVFIQNIYVVSSFTS